MADQNQKVGHNGDVVTVTTVPFNLPDKSKSKIRITDESAAKLNSK